MLILPPGGQELPASEKLRPRATLKALQVIMITHNTDTVRNGMLYACAELKLKNKLIYIIISNSSLLH